MKHQSTTPGDILIDGILTVLGMVVFGTLLLWLLLS